jgi:hypothetical protein
VTKEERMFVKQDMTDYDRGFAAGIEAAAKLVDDASEGRWSKIPIARGIRALAPPPTPGDAKAGECETCATCGGMRIGRTLLGVPSGQPCADCRGDGRRGT